MPRLQERGSRGGSVEWQTPPELVKALGKFNLDPCAALDQITPCARRFYTAKDDGLTKVWRGSVWMNPPYGHGVIAAWLGKLASHNNGIALIPARVDSRTFHKHVWPKADAILFLNRRLRFISTGKEETYPSMFPSCLVAYGSKMVARLEKLTPEWGVLIVLKDS